MADERDGNDLLVFLDKGMDRASDKPVETGKNIRRKTPHARPGKGGGGKGHPNSLAALAAHRAKGQLGNRPAHMLCRVCGKQPRVKGLEVCVFHGGRSTVNRRKEAAGLPVGYRVQIANRKILRLMDRGQIPVELMQTEIFRRAWAAKDLYNGAEKGSVSLEHRRAAIMLCWSLIRAWVIKERDGVYAPWQKCMSDAAELGIRLD